MRNRNTWRILLIVAITIAAFVSLFPTFRYLSLSKEEKENMKESELIEIQKRSLHLGLDLQGGIRLVLAVDEKALATSLGKKETEIKKEDIKDARDKALEIIRNRVDQFGVTEPLIQPEGSSWISIQLPGMSDVERAQKVIGETGLMEWKLVMEPKTVQEVIEKIDRKLQAVKGIKDTSLVEHIFSSQALFDGQEIQVAKESVDSVTLMLSDPNVKSVIPLDMEFLWGKLERRGALTFKPLYLLKKTPEITGRSLIDARMGIGTQNNPTEPRVDFRLNRRDAARFATVTGANIGRQLAIVLDGLVQSAPVIRSRIPNGAGQIELGSGSTDEAKDLAIILRAGALPTKIEIIHSEVVSPTLGQDSIAKGKVSALIGLFLVVLFMGFYYRISGTIADIGVLFNLLFLLAAMAGFRATLTMPGIAGIILTMGMSVDSNVLIFERIREELRAGKTIRTAIDAGYSKALATIIDSHVTTLITSAILFWFGSGPIRGFAVSLGLGVSISLFTALVITKVIFDIRKQYTTLSI